MPKIALAIAMVVAMVAVATDAIALTPFGGFSPADINRDGVVDARDVQGVINIALGLKPNLPPLPPPSSMQYAGREDDESLNPDDYLVLREDEDGIAILDDHLKRIKDGLATVYGDEPAPDWAMALEMMGYVAQVIDIIHNSLPAGAWHTGSGALRYQGGNCYSCAQALEALAKRDGIPARLCNARNPGDYSSGHVMTELYFSGKWRLLDPTFGVFFLNEDWEIASLHDVLENPTAVVENSWQIVAPIYSGVYQPNPGFRPIPENYRHIEQSLPLPPLPPLKEILRELYLQSFPADARLFEPQTKAISMPLELNFRGGKKELPPIRFGEEDDSAVDIGSIRDPMTYLVRRYQAWPTLGFNRHSETFFTVVIRVDRPSRYQITLHFLNEPTGMTIIPMKGVWVVSAGFTDTKAPYPSKATHHYQITVDVRDKDDGFFTVENRGEGVAVDAIEAVMKKFLETFELKVVDATTDDGGEQSQGIVIHLDGMAEMFADR